MVEIRPFKAYHYNFEKISSAHERLFAPPYDVISENLLQILREEPLNISNITLGKIDGSYDGAAEKLDKWRREGLVIQDERQHYYVYEQIFHREGRTFNRTGLIALTKLTPLGKVIMPHEKTHPKAKEDRLENLRAIRGNLEQIFLIYDDPSNSISEVLERHKQPENILISFVDFDDVKHRIFYIRSESDIAKITELLGDKSALIADGHHRYETSLLFSRLMDEESGNGSHDFVMATLVNAYDPGLLLLPTHRLIHSVDDSIVKNLPKLMNDKFDLEEIGERIVLVDRLNGQNEHGVFGIWLPGEKRGYIATLRPEYRSDDPEGRLDVSILHHLVLEELLGITPEMQERKEKIRYIRGTEEAFKEMIGEDNQILFLLNPPSIPDVIDVAKEGVTLPHKSTNFHPKFWSGLLMYLF